MTCSNKKGTCQLFYFYLKKIKMNRLFPAKQLTFTRIYIYKKLIDKNRNKQNFKQNISRHFHIV